MFLSDFKVFNIFEGRFITFPIDMLLLASVRFFFFLPTNEKCKTGELCLNTDRLLWWFSDLPNQSCQRKCTVTDETGFIKNDSLWRAYERAFTELICYSEFELINFLLIYVIRGYCVQIKIKKPFQFNLHCFFYHFKNTNFKSGKTVI